jgi:exosome complex component RRP42
MLKISTSEQKYIIEGIEENVRADGRKRLAYRNLSIESSLLSQSNGSARVSLQNSGTDVLASVKLETTQPRPEAPNAGIMQVSVSCCPSVSAKLSGRAAEEMNVELSQQMTRYVCLCKALLYNKNES